MRRRGRRISDAMELQPEYHDMKLHDFAIAPGRACLERCSEMQPASAEMAYAVMTTALQNA